MFLVENVKVAEHIKGAPHWIKVTSDVEQETYSYNCYTVHDKVPYSFLTSS